MIGSFGKLIVINMDSDQFCKLLIEESIKNSGIPESKRYTAHFDHKDLVKRLLRVKSERSKEFHVNEAQVTFRNLKIHVNNGGKTTRRLKSKKKSELCTQRVIKHESLPKIKPAMNKNLSTDAKGSKSSRELKKKRNLGALFNRIKTQRQLI
jgi:hypothetical protein